MTTEQYAKELRKDINIIKKDLRAISIKTRIIARELEIEDNDKTPTIKIKQPSSWVKLLNNVKGWFGIK